MKPVRTMIRNARLRRAKTSKPPLLMFDFDGVVADSFEVFYEEFTGAVKLLGWDKLNSRESLLKLMEGNPLAGLVKMGFPVWRLKQLGEQFAPRIEAANSRIEPFPGMPSLLTELAAAHPVYVITSNQTRAVELFLEKHGVQGVLEVVGADKEASKVKKIRKVRKKHPGLQGWYFGDTKGDMVEAGIAGATTVAIAWGWHPVETLAEGKPDHIVHDQEALRVLIKEVAAKPAPASAPPAEA
jgi:phosphoglycolate phosphatase